MKKLIECVPNFSEGRDLNIIKQITDRIQSVEGVKLLDVDPGASTNRTVVTLVGEPDAVIEAAFRGIQKAGELIDMRKHSGAHPRMGATDVCPLIPISGVSEEEAVKYAHQLAKRVGEELGIPTYLYENAATEPKRSNLSVIREGEYEAFSTKIYNPEWKPDYGTAEFNAFSGATVIGVRDFLIAYNVNLNTQSVRRANSVAYDIREKGRVKTVDGKPYSEKVRDAEGKVVWEPGMLKAAKGIGWFVEEYGIAQVSMNLTNISITSMHEAFEACRTSANRRGLRVTGSEVIGLLPKKCLIDAGKYYLQQQNRSLGIAEEDIIYVAVKSMGLDELAPFNPKEKIIEYAIEADSNDRLVDMTLVKFNNVLASEAPAPGGGSVAALCGALGASLAGMVANLSSNTTGWDARVKEFSPWAEKAQAIKDELLFLIDEDTRAFTQVMESVRLPKESETEKQERARAMDAANKYAAEIPFRVMEASFRAFEIQDLMAQTGNPNSVSDAGVGALCTYAAVAGAGLNVKINLGGIDDESYCRELKTKTEQLIAKAAKRQSEILALVETKL